MVTDFEAGSGMGDRIWFGAASGMSSWDDVQNAVLDTTDGVLITFDSGSVLLAGVSTFDLHQDDFII